MYSLLSSVRATGGVSESLELLPTKCRTLAVGEGDFVFSEALAASRGSQSGTLVVSCLESEAECVDQYAGVQQRLQQLRDYGAEVICGVDATRLTSGPLMGLAPFERIIFNFPLLPMKVHKPRASNNDVQIANRAMLVEFLRGAASFLRKDGVLLIANKPSSSPPPASAPSAPSSPPQPGQEEVRHVTREMQRLEVDVMKPLQDILDNPPSSDTTELVDLLLSEAHAKVEELHQQADFFVELGHFDVFQKIADLKGNFDDISARASSWKEAAVHSASSPAATPAAATPAAATPAAATPPAASPSLSSAQARRVWDPPWVSGFSLFANRGRRDTCICLLMPSFVEVSAQKAQKAPSEQNHHVTV
eukprot:symbB.v1.2.006221.t1/scaffold340.1/size245066/7